MTEDPWKHPPKRSGKSLFKRPFTGRRLVIWLFALIGLLAVLKWIYPSETLNSAGEVLTIVTLVTIGSLVLLSLRMRFGEFLRNLAIWSGLVLLLVLGFTYRHELGDVAERVMASAQPARGYEDGGALVFERSGDGHFHIRASIRGKRINFLVDTGASHVILSGRDAERLGISPPRDAFFERYYTANGVVMAAPIILREVQIGDAVKLYNVRASVTEGELHVSLLGMSFLNRMEGFEITGETLRIRP